MDKLPKIEEYIRRYKRHALWQRCLMLSAMIVVFVTTYMLILPAIAMESKPVCGYEEHTHGGACYDEENHLICDKEESDGHSHDSGCYSTISILTCSMPEHTHVEACYPIESSKAETTEEVTWEEEIPMVETTEAVQEESANETEAEETARETEAVTEEEFEEIVGELMGDPNADVENAAIWEKTMANVKLTGVWADDLLAIAYSQLGYRESTENYYLTENGDKKGYSRYGDWYGNAYGDWCAMYVSFCIHYAGIKDYPINASCVNWIAALKKLDLYHKAGSGYEPKPGDLIFFNFRKEKASDHVGIVVRVENGRIHTIEGNAGNRVCERSYRVGDNDIAGFGEMIENPELAVPETEETITGGTFTYEDDTLIVTAVTDEETTLPADTQLMVSRLAENSVVYCTAEEKILEYAEGQEMVLDGYVLYDMHLESDGQEIEPEGGSVQVTVRYKQALQLSEDENNTLTEETVQVLHLVESGSELVVEEVTESIEVNAREEVKEAVFVTESFSTIALVNTDTTKGTGWITAGKTVNFRTVLGDASYYGMTLHTFNKTGHVDSTFAANTLHFNGSTDVTTGKYTNDKAGAIWVAEATVNGSGRLQVHGSPTVIHAPQDVLDQLDLKDGCTGEVVTKQAADAYVNKLFSHLEAQSEMLAEQETTTWYSTDQNKWNNDGKTIDLTELPAGTYYLDGDFFFGQKYDLKIKMNGDQNVVFNFSSTNPQICQYKGVVDGVEIDSASSNGSIEPLATRVIFNMPNATTLTQQGGFCGIVLAPKAKYTIGSTSSGWICCDTLQSDAGEWHFIYQDLPTQIPTSTGFKAEKTVDGKKPGAGETFTFTLKELADGKWSSPLQSVTNTEGLVAFEEITYTSAGTYWYMVEESAGTDSSYSYSSEKYLYKVTVTTKTTTTGVELVENVDTYKVTDAEHLLISGTINAAAISEILSSDDVFHNEKVSSAEIEVEKIWKKADGSALEDSKKQEITFKLYKLTNGESPAEVPAPEGTRYALNEANNWHMKISDLPLKDKVGDSEFNYTYYVVENPEVDGFNITYTRINGTDSTAATADPVALASTGGRFKINNTERAESQVTVNKKWFKTINGEAPQEIQRDGYIEFDLYRVAVPDGTEGTANESSGSEVPEGAEKLNETPLQIHSGQNWTWSGTFEAEPGYTYKYYAVELDESNNHVITYENQGTDNITINNTLDEKTYELPHTGGMGTTRWYTMGALLVIVSLVSLMYIKN